MAEVLTDITDGVAVVTLDAPDRRNALTLPLVDEITAALDAVEADPAVGAMVVTGTAPAFCAGADLTHLGDSQREGLLAIYEGFLRIGRSPLPSVAAVNGAAVGAGVNLALVCDVIVAGASARIDTRFLALGLHPGGGHTWMLQRRVGPQAAAAMVLFGEVLDGARAAEAGCSTRPGPWPPWPPRPRATWWRRSSRRWSTCGRSTTTPRRSSASSAPRCGRSTSPRSRRSWPPCSAASDPGARDRNSPAP
jgi:enoyl-CoA hydratase